MHKIVFAYTEETPRSRYLTDLLKDDFDLVTAPSCEAITDILHNDYESIDSLIIDHPSDKSDIDRLFRYVDKHNSFMFTLPIIILTDRASMHDDDAFISDLVVGMIVEGEPRRTVLQRIRNTIKFCASTSFDDFSRMLRHLPSIIYVKDSAGRYIFCSQRWHHLRKPDESVRGLTDFDIRKSKENARIARENDLKVLQSGKGMSYLIKESDDEGTEYLEVVKEPLRDEQGKVEGIIAIINNVTDSELLKEELREKSITDQLTGLFNRSYFEEVVGKMKKGIDVPMTFVSADCDGLKTINDEFGHAAGDRYICMARDAIQGKLPEGSYLFRMGGDEFLAIVPRMDEEDANALVASIIENVKNFKTDRFQLRLSVGSYTVSRVEESIERAVNRSDKAMYRMKKSH